jgi:hypothetical protein
MQWMTYASAVAGDRRRLGRPSAQRCWESLAPPIGWVVDVVTDALLFVVPGWQWPAFAGVRGDTGRRGTSILAAGGWSNCCLRHASAKGSLRRRTLGQRFGKRAWAFSPTTARAGLPFFGWHVGPRGGMANSAQQDLRRDHRAIYFGPPNSSQHRHIICDTCCYFTDLVEQARSSEEP